MNIFDEPVISIDRKGLHIVSSDIYEKLEKKNLSASLITGVSSCPARWLADSFVMRDLIKDEPDNAARRGVVYHLIMELFFQETPNNRTKKKLNEITNHVLTMEEFSDLAQIPDFLQWLKQSIRNYYDMGAKPELVEVAKIKNDKGELKTGLEVFVKGNIGGTKRDILGFIDRLIVDKRSKDYAVFIEDWKSGGKVKKWKHHTKGDDGLAEARQQIIYKMLLEQQGLKVTGARLIFPVAKEIVNVDINNEDFNNRVINDVKLADEKLDIMTEENTFEYVPSFLCAWCPLAKVCSAATIKPYKKMQDAFENQPSPELLSQAFEVI